MEIKFQTTKFVKVDDQEVTKQIPEEQQFYFETGVRRSICITPIWTTWNEENYQKPEEIYKLSVICVYRSFEDRIELFEIAVSDIPRLYAFGTTNIKSTSREIIDFLQYNGIKGNRTAERFIADYNAVLSKINESMQC